MLLRCGVLAGGDLPRRVEAWLAGLASVAPSTSLAELRMELEADSLDLAIVARDADLAFSPAWVAKVRELESAPEVVVLSEREDPSERSAFLAAGCLGVLYGGLRSEEIAAALHGLVRRALAARPVAIPAPPDERYRLSDYVTLSQTMQRFLRMALRVARTDTTTLLLGETGVGKGLLARAIHNESVREEGPFVPVNCGALVDTLLESELFGHERGAFTGAHRARRGHFELASGGTLFLDEIIDLPLHLQSRLLSVMEDRAVRPVGSERVRAVDVRLIAATNRDLKAEVAAGRFREDLYYRLNVLTLTLPPLRERRADIRELVQSYTAYFAQRFRNPVRGIAPEAMATLERYDWPGNLRELRNVIERAALLASDAEIGLADLPPDVASVPGACSAPSRLPTSEELPGEPSGWLELPWREAREHLLEQAERRYLVHALARNQGRVGLAAAHAGIDPRSLYEKMRRHGIRKQDFRPRVGSGAERPIARPTR